MESTEKNKEKFTSHHFTFTIETYKNLKQEVFKRSDYQMQCIIQSIISIAILTSANLVNKDTFAFLLLVIPWLLTIYGITWCDHHKHIQLMGTYIKKIEEKIVADANFLKGWEYYLDIYKINSGKKEIKKINRLLLLDVIYPIFYFFIPSLISLLSFIIIKYQLLLSILKCKLLSCINLNYFINLKEPIFYSLIIILDFILIIMLIIVWFDSYILTSNRLK